MRRQSGSSVRRFSPFPGTRQLYLRPVCAAVLAAALLASGCSSAPKRKMEVFTVRNAAVSQLELGNKSLFQGNTARAYANFEAAYRLAVSVDDSDLVCAVLFAMAGAALSSGGEQGAKDARIIIDKAKTFAATAENKKLAYMCTLYDARILLAGSQAEEALRLAREAEKGLSGNPFDTAFALRVQGEALRDLGQWNEAEKTLLRAADLHTKNRYLDEIGQDWYLVAQVHSLAGDYGDALKALDTAVRYDRAAENSTGLGMDYYAQALVLEKMNRTAESRSAAVRSAEIFSAAGLAEQAAAAEKRFGIEITQ